MRAGVRFYQHTVHRSRAHLASPSLAATLNLLLLRWLGLGLGLGPGLGLGFRVRVRLGLTLTLTLTLIRLDHDYPAAFQLCGCCGSDTPLSTEEAQLWALLADLHEDHEPGAHACRLRLWVATRCCPELVCPWSPGEELQAYLCKMHHLPPSLYLPHIPPISPLYLRYISPNQAYLCKVHHLPPSCHLAPALELELLRCFPPPDAAATTRRALLEATL